MNRIFWITISFIAMSATTLAFTSEEAYQITSCLIDRYTMSNEWDDNLNESSDEEIEIEFQTPDDLFSCSFETNKIAFNLSADERRQAFNQFLSEFAGTNRLCISKAYERTGAYALVFSAETGYTNAFTIAKDILSREDAPCRAEAYTVIRRLSYPSLSTSDYLYSILTNDTWYSAYNRNMIFSDYASRLKLESRHTIQTNGISMLRNASSHVRAKIPWDDLLTCVYPQYATSSNRLEYARSVLLMPEITTKEEAYFSDVTNRLGSIENSLCTIVVP